MEEATTSVQLHCGPQPDTVIGLTGLNKSSPSPASGLTKEEAYLPNIYLSNGRIQSPATIQWLLEHFEPYERGSLPRNSLYSVYDEYCNQTGISAVNAASFGKLVRQTFPFIRTRRLGTRGQSKYHYYGIRVKNVSPYLSYFDTLVQKGAFPTSRIQRQYSPYRAECPVSSSYLLTDSHCAMNAEHLRDRHPELDPNSLLPDLPTAYHITLPADVPIDKTQTFLVMYQAHCQILVDAILRANFLEIESHLKQFWQGIPSNLLVVVGCHAIIDQVALFDWKLYKNLLGILIPRPMEPMISSFVQALRQFSRCYIPWIRDNTVHIPMAMSEVKVQAGKMFTTCLRRQTAMTHLCQACRGHFSRSENIEGMLQDWKSLDLESINRQILWATNTTTETDYKCLRQAETEFESLIGQPLTMLVDWVSGLMDKAILQVSATRVCKFDVAAQNFFLKWMFLSNKIIRDLTLKSAESFGSFHLIQTVLNEYILYLLEAHTNEVIESQMISAAQTTLKTNSEVTTPYAVQVEFLPELLSTAKSTSSHSHVVQPLIPLSTIHHPQLFFSQSSIHPDTVTSNPEICPQQNIFVTSFHQHSVSTDARSIGQAMATDSTSHPAHVITPLAGSIDDHTYSLKLDMTPQSFRAESENSATQLIQHLQDASMVNKEGELVDSEKDQARVHQTSTPTQHKVPSDVATSP